MSVNNLNWSQLWNMWIWEVIECVYVQIKYPVWNVVMPLNIKYFYFKHSFAIRILDNDVIFYPLYCNEFRISIQSKYLTHVLKICWFIVWIENINSGVSKELERIFNKRKYTSFLWHFDWMTGYKICYHIIHLCIR